jgi:hypothetical protein
MKEEKKTDYEKNMVQARSETVEFARAHSLVPQKTEFVATAQRFVSSKNNNSKAVDVTDKTMWPQIHMILTHFPGVVTFVDR